jgi:hypothetical protein
LTAFILFIFIISNELINIWWIIEKINVGKMIGVETRVFIISNELINIWWIIEKINVGKMIGVETRVGGGPQMEPTSCAFPIVPTPQRERRGRKVHRATRATSFFLRSSSHIIP